MAASGLFGASFSINVLVPLRDGTIYTMRYKHHSTLILFDSANICTRYKVLNGERRAVIKDELRACGWMKAYVEGEIA